MKSRTARVGVYAAGFLLVLAAAAQAQTEAGTFAAVQGKVQLQRRGAWQDATVGTALAIGDRVRTGSTDRAKLVFRDDTILSLGPATEVVLDDQVFEPPAHRFQAALRLFTGKLHVWISDYYREPGAHYEIETPTAVAGVRGTEFIVLYNSGSEVTEVIGVENRVDVVGKISVMGGGRIQVEPQMLVRVQKGRLPTAPEHIDDSRLRQYLQGLDLVGTGRRDGLNVLHPVIAGRLIAPEDVPGGSKPADEVSAGLGASAPPLPLSPRLSLDVYSNTQPLQVFQAFPPGVAPTGGVRVNF